MADNNQTILAKPENVSEQQQENPLLALFQKFQLLFPQPNQASKANVVVSDESKPVLNESDSSNKPDMVKFSTAPPIAPPPLKLEADEYEQSTSPAVLWQVYALGGFIVLKWVWARWNERKAKKGPSDEEPSPEED